MLIHPAPPYGLSETYHGFTRPLKVRTREASNDRLMHDGRPPLQRHPSEDVERRPWGGLESASWHVVNRGTMAIVAVYGPAEGSRTCQVRPGMQELQCVRLGKILIDNRRFCLLS